MKSVITSLVFLMVITGSLSAQEDYKKINERLVFENADFYDVKEYSEKELRFKRKPKNIILMIGDGMGVAHVFAGITANKGVLHLSNMKHIGFSKTQSADQYVTDSAAGGTAISTGKKTNNGAIGVDEHGNPAETILEIAERNEKATGLVSTSAITHATPASFIAHQPKRSMYEEIAADFLKTEIDVFIGGGHDFFTQRQDGRNLVKELQGNGYHVFGGLDKVPEGIRSKLVVLTAPAHNPAYRERGEMLLQSTQKAIQVLDASSEKGFFLMVEGSQVDWGGHANDASYVTGEVLDFDKAIGAALKYAVESRNTLVIVTSDHETGGMSLNNGNMSTGKVQAGFTTGSHTGEMVPVFAFGPGAEEFMGIYENTELFDKMLKLYRFKK
jgi:alkaline phosphatase